jgi:hypothetical protein
MSKPLINPPKVYASGDLTETFYRSFTRLIKVDKASGDKTVAGANEAFDASGGDLSLLQVRIPVSYITPKSDNDRHDADTAAIFMPLAEQVAGSCVKGLLLHSSNPIPSIDKVDSTILGGCLTQAKVGKEGVPSLHPEDLLQEELTVRQVQDFFSWGSFWRSPCYNWLGNTKGIFIPRRLDNPYGITFTPAIDEAGVVNGTNLPVPVFMYEPVSAQTSRSSHVQSHVQTKILDESPSGSLWLACKDNTGESWSMVDRPLNESLYDEEARRSLRIWDCIDYDKVRTGAKEGLSSLL